MLGMMMPSIISASLFILETAFTPCHEPDAHLAWELGQGVEPALIWRNQLDKQHVEFGSFFSRRLPPLREVFATIRWNFEHYA